MASEVVSVASESIRDLLIEEVRFLSGVSQKVEGLRTQLSLMQCFLKDADRKQLKDLTVRQYVRQIRQLAYRIENVLEDYAIQVESRKGCGFRKALERFACILCEGIAVHIVGSKIANITANIQSLTTSLETCGVERISPEEGQSSSATVDQNLQLLRQTYAHEIEEYFVGMKDDIEQLVPLIADEETRPHRVISIHGMGGIGKTTLARKIYNHIQVQRSFKKFAWVCVTQQYNARTILRDILKQLLPGQSVENMEETELVRELYKVQKETKCLVVLDDLWEIEHWECLKRAFPFKEANSKVLITTRNEELAKEEFRHPLQLLNEDEGWELLRKRAFGKRDAKDSENDPKSEAERREISCTPTLENDSEFEIVGKEIVRKCGRLPLAISTLGGVLSQSNSLGDWETVNKKVDVYLSEGGEKKDGSVLQMLALSYDELPYHLKPCFLYLGQFDEDKDINVEMLYLMWIAEGMVSSSHLGKEETLTDVAEKYLYEMANRSMVQLKVAKFSLNGRVKSCRLHDLMREFCVTRGNEVGFSQLLDFRGGRDPLSDSSTDDCGTPARYSILMGNHIGLSLHDHHASLINKAMDANGQLRSLLITSTFHWFRDVDSQLAIGDSKKCKYLRVLKIEVFQFKGKRLPRGIEKLIHLRFLSLRGSQLNKLPSSICHLQYLQTLDLRTFGDIEVPNVLWMLKRLRHLYLNSFSRAKEGKLSFKGLSKLETLVGFNNKSHDFKDVLELNNLRRFNAVVEIFKKNELSEILNYLNSKYHKLQEVRIDISFCGVSRYDLTEENNRVQNEDFISLPSLHKLGLSYCKFVFQKVERSLFRCSKLTRLNLIRCEIKGDPMDFLGKLPNLMMLHLQTVKLEDRKMACDPNAFPELRYLILTEVDQLDSWIVAQGSMPKLAYLHIYDCNDLEMIPDGLRSITTLKKFYITGPPDFFKRIEGPEAVDYDKISHVPVITKETI